MELSVLGWSQNQIAEDLGVSQAAVSKILRRVEERVLRDLRAIVERQKARHSMRLEHLYAESMRAWGDSKVDSTRRRQRKTQAGTGSGGTTVAEVVSENQHGDPRYLEEARKSLADHRKLWGLDAPQRVDVRASRNPYDDMTEEALRDELARQTRLLAVGRPVADESTTHDQTEATPKDTDDDHK
jgi:transcriptional regulator with XRE-family HTH domain